MGETIAMLVHSLNEFLSMGGYGAYVWSAYVIGAGVLIGQVVLALRK